ncbi:MAG: GH36 C-terminal domain-containing protein [Armatimonadetes bacterium]|nr:GH36 C-terminal domain-containing protein [Armatimonadota bacterium]
MAGQELTRFRLRPGEEVRAPLALVQFCDGDWVRGQNLWRRWMVAHNIPRPNGNLVPACYAGCFANLQPVSEEEIGSIEGFAREGIGLDCWILDAGWYKDRGSWIYTGMWEVDRSRFPKGVCEVSDRARTRGFEGAATQQCQTYGLSFWVPYYGSGTGMTDEYMFRICIFSASRAGGDARRRDLDYPLLKRRVGEFRKAQPYLLGDYYPLTPYSLEKNVWIGWQFDSPEKGGGFVQAFRREEASQESLAVNLRGLDPAADYAVGNLDTGRSERLTGQDLMLKGLTVTLPRKPAAALYVYRRVR